MPQMKMAPLLAGKEGQSVANLQRYFTRHLHLDTSSIAVSARHTCHPGQNGNHRRNATVRHHAGAILRPSPKGMVCRNTLNVAVQVPTEESGALLCPEFNTAGNSRSSGCGLGAVDRKAIGVATFTLRTPSPPDACRNVSSGFFSHVGHETMKSTTTGQTAPTQNHDHHQAALVLRAQNHLALALYQLRNSTGDTPTRKAMGLAYAAARSLSQVVGGAHHV